MEQYQKNEYLELYQLLYDYEVISDEEFQLLNDIMFGDHIYIHNFILLTSKDIFKDVIKCYEDDSCDEVEMQHRVTRLRTLITKIKYALDKKFL